MFEKGAPLNFQELILVRIHGLRNALYSFGLFGFGDLTNG